MYELFMHGDGYMICDPMGVQKALIRDGAFAEQVVNALNYEVERENHKSEEEWEAEMDDLRQDYNDLDASHAETIQTLKEYEEDREKVRKILMAALEELV